MDVNVITISGNLVKDPDFSITSGGTDMVKFSIANNRKYKEKWVNFFSCVAWGGTAKIVNDYCHKGKKVTLVGEMKQDRWEDNDGKKQSRDSIIVREVILAPKSTGEEKPLTDKQADTSDTGSFDDQNEFVDIPDDALF